MDYRRPERAGCTTQRKAMISDGKKDIRDCLFELEQSAIGRNDMEDLELVQQVMKFIDEQETTILKFFQQK